MTRSWVGPARLVGCLGIGLSAWFFLPWSGWQLAAAVKPLLHLAVFTSGDYRYPAVIEAMAWVVIGACLTGAALTVGLLKAWWEAVPGLHNPAVATPPSPDTIRLPATPVGIGIFVAVVGPPAAALVDLLDSDILLDINDLSGIPLATLVRGAALCLHLAGTGAGALAAYAWLRAGHLATRSAERRQPSPHEQPTS